MSEEAEVKNWQELTQLQVDSLIAYCESHALEIPEGPTKRALLLQIRKNRKYINELGDSLSACSESSESLFRNRPSLESKNNQERLKRWWTSKHLKENSKKSRSTVYRKRSQKTQVSAKGSPYENSNANSGDRMQQDDDIVIDKWKKVKRAPEVSAQVLNNVYGNRDALDKASEDFAPVEMIDSASLEALDSTQEPENSAVSPELVTVSQSDALDTMSDNSAGAQVLREDADAHENSDAPDKASKDSVPVKMTDDVSLEALDSPQESENSAVSPELVTVSPSDPILDAISDNIAGLQSWGEDADDSEHVISEDLSAAASRNSKEPITPKKDSANFFIDSVLPSPIESSRNSAKLSELKGMLAKESMEYLPGMLSKQSMEFEPQSKPLFLFPFKKELEKADDAGGSNVSLEDFDEPAVGGANFDSTMSPIPNVLQEDNEKTSDTDEQQDQSGGADVSDKEIGEVQLEESTQDKSEGDEVAKVVARMDDADGALSNEEKVTHVDNGEESKDKEVESEEMGIHKIKKTWIVGSNLEVFSQSTGEWYEGSILSIDIDSEGEWLTVQYDTQKQKQIQRFSENLKPLSLEEENGESAGGEFVEPVISDALIEMTEEEAEDKVRMDWNAGAKLEVFSQSTGDWSSGKILSVDVDDEGEWLTVSYGPDYGKQKQIQRWNANIKPLQEDIDGALQEHIAKTTKSTSDASDDGSDSGSMSEEVRAEYIEKVRKAWTKGSQLEVFSQSTAKWYDGKILSIDNDSEGEWLTVQYDNQKQKQIQRFNKNIRPLESDIMKEEASSPEKMILLEKVSKPKTPTSDPDLIKSVWPNLGVSNLYKQPAFNDRVLLRIIGNLRRKEMLQASRAELLRLQISTLESTLMKEQVKLDDMRGMLDSTRAGNKRRDSITSATPLFAAVDSERENEEYIEKIREQLRRASESSNMSNRL